MSEAPAPAVVRTPEEQGPPPQLIKVKLKDLVTHPAQPRRAYNPKVVDGMRAAYKANANPATGRSEFPVGMAITVRDVGMKKVIISGHTRVEAAKAEGLFWVWAIVGQYKSDEEAAMAVMLANNQQELLMHEVGFHAKYMREKEGLAYADYGKRMGRDYQFVRNCVRVHELCERFHYMGDNIKQIPPTTLMLIDEISRDGQPNTTDRLQFETLRWTLHHMPTGGVLKEVVKQVNAGVEPAEAFEAVLTKKQIVYLEKKVSASDEPTNVRTSSEVDREAVKQAKKALTQAHKTVSDAATRINELSEQLAAAQAENQQLRREVERLKDLLSTKS